MAALVVGFGACDLPTAGAVVVDIGACDLPTVGAIVGAMWCVVGACVDVGVVVRVALDGSWFRG